MECLNLCGDENRHVARLTITAILPWMHHPRRRHRRIGGIGGHRGTIAPWRAGHHSVRPLRRAAARRMKSSAERSAPPLGDMTVADGALPLASLLSAFGWAFGPRFFGSWKSSRPVKAERSSFNRLAWPPCTIPASAFFLRALQTAEDRWPLEKGSPSACAAPAA